MTKLPRKFITRYLFYLAVWTSRRKSVKIGEQREVLVCTQATVV